MKHCINKESSPRPSLKLRGVMSTQYCRATLALSATQPQPRSSFVFLDQSESNNNWSPSWTKSPAISLSLIETRRECVCVSERASERAWEREGGLRKREIIFRWRQIFNCCAPSGWKFCALITKQILLLLFLWQILVKCQIKKTLTATKKLRTILYVFV